MRIPSIGSCLRPLGTHPGGPPWSSLLGFMWGTFKFCRKEKEQLPLSSTSAGTSAGTPADTHKHTHTHQGGLPLCQHCVANVRIPMFQSVLPPVLVTLYSLTARDRKTSGIKPPKNVSRLLSIIAGTVSLYGRTLWILLKLS